MEGFVTLSSIFVASMVLVIIYLVTGHGGLAMLPLVGATVTGYAIARMVVRPVKRPSVYED